MLCTKSVFLLKKTKKEDSDKDSLLAANENKRDEFKKQYSANECKMITNVINDCKISKEKHMSIAIP